MAFLSCSFVAAINRIFTLIVLVPQTLAISSTKTVPPLAMRMHPHTTWNGSGQAVVTRVAPVGAKRTAQPVRAASSGATVRRKDGERGRNRTYNLLIAHLPLKTRGFNDFPV